MHFDGKLHLTLLLMQFLLVAGFPEMMEAAFDFICEQGSPQAKSQGNPSSSQSIEGIIETLEDLITVTSELPISKVCITQKRYFAALSVMP